MSFTPPLQVQRAARQGLELRRKYRRGGTMVGVARARDLSNGRAVSLTTLKRIKSYFARHEVDKNSPKWNDPSAGKIAWLLWGGDSGRAWANGLLRKHIANPTTQLPTQCAWCRRLVDDDGEPHGKALTVQDRWSHGVCNECVMQLMKKAKMKVGKNPLSKSTAEVWKLCRKVTELEEQGINGARLRTARSQFLAAYRQLPKAQRLELMEALHQKQLKNPEGSTADVKSALEAMGYEVIVGKGGYWLKGHGFISLAKARQMVGIKAVARPPRMEQLPWGDYAIVQMLNQPRRKTGKNPTNYTPLDITHAKGVRAAVDLGGMNYVGAANLKKADKVLEKAGLVPTHYKVDKITEAWLVELYSKKKRPVVGDTITSKNGFRIEIVKVAKEPTETGAIQVSYMTFPLKGKGRISSIYLHQVANNPQSYAPCPSCMNVIPIPMLNPFTCKKCHAVIGIR